MNNRVVMPGKRDDYVSSALTKKMIQNREKMKRERPKAYEKLMNYLKLGNVPENPYLARLDWAINYDCNLKCQHCFAGAFEGKISDYKMTMDDIRKVAGQADEAGVFMINLIGGEPLVWPDLRDIIETLDPKRFKISITTNGWNLTKERAKELAGMGVDRVCVSVDSFFADEHDNFRGVAGSHARATAAVLNSLAAGIVTQVATCVTHQNLRSEGITKLLEWTDKLGVYMDLPAAAPCGKWLGKTDMLITEEDAKYIRDLRKKYPLVRRDIFPSPGLQGGCFAVKQTLYIIPTGDVLPCLFIHISLGNALKEHLRDIRARGLKIKRFRDFSEKCLAAEDHDFISKYLLCTFNAKVLPVSPEEGWGSEYDKSRS